MLTLPPHDDALLTRDATAEALTANGFRIKSATLATMATRGGGPDYVMFGRVPLYRWQTSLAWAQARLAVPRSRSAATFGAAGSTLADHAAEVEPAAT
jgi:hypothetical protein